MNSASLSTPLTIDTLLRDTFVSVLQLRAGTSAKDGLSLYQAAKHQIETVQSTLREAQYSEEVIADITYAQCAILDEAVMNRHLLDTNDKAYQTWVGIPLQIHFFNTLEAGEALYERIQSVMAQVAPNPLVIACFHRVLLLGFSGKFGANSQHPEREAIVQRLENLVQQMGQLPMQSDQHVFLGARKRHIWQLPTRNRWWIGLGFLTLFIYGLWWGFDYQLTAQLARVIPSQSMIEKQHLDVPIESKETETAVVPINNHDANIVDNKQVEALSVLDSDALNNTAQSVTRSQEAATELAPKMESTQLSSSTNNTLTPPVENEAPARVVKPKQSEVDRD
ncbi:type IV / VI secretion system protein, DotU family [Thorsellia anophelis DSM 18579]|uniref:Type IV / VI secretion system protein, DotU family n=2 Tax=Thorsellia anophelis TaxID=336804 RepID=A0A1I0FBQ9_9GAMM|nr:type IV / VI secretion system protein, DotU family [Thorsellia anophelis DSM 18579]